MDRGAAWAPVTGSVATRNSTASSVGPPWYREKFAGGTVRMGKSSYEPSGKAGESSHVSCQKLCHGRETVAQTRNKGVGKFAQVRPFPHKPNPMRTPPPPPLPPGGVSAPRCPPAWPVRVLPGPWQTSPRHHKRSWRVARSAVAGCPAVPCAVRIPTAGPGLCTRWGSAPTEPAASVAQATSDPLHRLPRMPVPASGVQPGSVGPGRALSAPILVSFFCFGTALQF